MPVDFNNKNKRRLEKGRVDDLVLLEEVSENGIVTTLGNRFEKKDIYTYIGNVLLSVNPYRKISGLYEDDRLQDYVNKKTYELVPHVYAIAEAAYRSMVRDSKNQCILISGESGSGKTVNAKHVLEYITRVSESKSKETKDILLNSNPVLESFGNAKTIRNDNSSRFAKYMEINFDYSGAPVMGQIHNYLLERSRIVTQSEGEQNFHIFYILLEGMDAQRRESFHLNGKNETHFRCIGNTARTSKNPGDLTFENVQQSLSTVGVSKEDQNGIFQVLATILHLLNIDFQDDHQAGDKNTGKTGSKIAQESKDSLQIVASLLGLSKGDEAQLETVLTQRKIIARGESMDHILKKEEAEKTRDALAKALYGRVFEFIVKSINDAMACTTHAQTSRNCYGNIGILDIYGFEIFQQNSFEQLCINYCNEKLQQLFIELTLKSEQDEYAAEGIEWEHIDYFNNKIVCDLIELKGKPRPGVISLLDEECSLLGKVSDLTLLKKMDRVLRDDPHYIEVKTSPTEFTIKHYAGEVKYDVSGFLDKNKDTLYRDLIELLGNKSEIEFIKTLFPEASERRTNKKPPTAGSEIRQQMQQLIARLQKCDPHYIRCLKTDRGRFDSDLIRDQVRYLGLLENVKVRRAGFAHRESKDDFVNRYKMLSSETWPKTSGKLDKDIASILDTVGIDEEGYRFGETKVFIRKPMALFALETMREHCLQKLVIKMQSLWRQYQQKKRLIELKEKAMKLFEGLKRRRGSFRYYFVGDYVDAGANPMFMKFTNGSPILFADVVEKVNRNGKIQRRLLVLTGDAVLLFRTKAKTCEPTGLSRRVEFSQLENAKLSSFADGFVCFDIRKSSSLVFYSQRKSEIITHLKQAHQNVTIQFQDSFEYTSQKPAKFALNVSNKDCNLEKRKMIFEESPGETIQTNKVLPRTAYTKGKPQQEGLFKVFVPPLMASQALIQLSPAC